MPRRVLNVDWAKDAGPLDMRYHSMGIGGISSLPPSAKIVDKMALLKPRFIRIFLQEYFYIYPKHGVYDWSRLDPYMDAVHAMGGDIMASICIKPKVLYPELDESIWMPNDVTEWQELIRALVLRYSKEKPYVTHWAIANEQNIGELGGCPYLIEDPDDYFKYYKLTAAPIREALPGIKVGGPSNASGAGNSLYDDGTADYLARFVELCKLHNEPVDFVCYNRYSDDPATHAFIGRRVRNALDKHNPDVKLYMTEFNNALIINSNPSLEEDAFDPARPASLAASILAFHEDGCLDGSFEYHIYDQNNDPNEFAPWYSRVRYMAEHWNDIPHRLGLFDLDGKARPLYCMYHMLYEMIGKRIIMSGTDHILRGIASINQDRTMSMFLTNFSVEGSYDSVTQFKFKNTEKGMYRVIVTRIDRETATHMKMNSIDMIEPVENRLVYAYPDFHFDVFTPADSVTLIQLVKQ